MAESTATEDAERALEAAEAAWARMDPDALVAHLSTAVRVFTSAGEKCRAAMVCVQLGDAYTNALGNTTAGRAWFARARRLVENEPPCLEQGWVAIAAMGCDVDDPAELLASAELALDRARRFGDVDLETKALADAGLAHVQAGRLREGMALLDEAMALACGPAQTTDAAQKSVCSFFTACYYAADFERAGSWADTLRRHGLIGLDSPPQAFVSSHCDSVQATALMELGRWGDAELLLQRARADFARVVPAPSWHADIALADLRIRQGRLAEAEELLLGKDQSIQALLPAARLHLARGDADLALAAARRGVRAVAADRLRAAELMAIVVDAELARGDVTAAAAACADLTDRLADAPAALVGRAAGARARVLAAQGDLDDAIVVLEDALAGLDDRQLPALRISLLVELARVRGRAGDLVGARRDATAARSALDSLDMSVPGGDRDLLERLTRMAAEVPAPAAVATMTRDGKWWTLTHDGTNVRLPDTKGLRYLAELVASAGVERHALDLVDRVEGVSVDGLDRRALGDAGPVLDSRARAEYRRRIEDLRAQIEDALAAGLLETAEALQDELDQYVRQLAQAFGLGGRGRRGGSAVEKARLNVTRALRAAIGKVTEAHPGPGAVLDRRVRTGIYCVFEPVPGEVRWIVQS